jgi:hypothetical protein
MAVPAFLYLLALLQTVQVLVSSNKDLIVDGNGTREGVSLELIHGENLER